MASRRLNPGAHKAETAGFKTRNGICGLKDFPTHWRAKPWQGKGFYDTLPNGTIN